MSIQERFEKFYAETHDMTVEYVAQQRMSNGSYRDLRTANAFRNFQGGFDSAMQQMNDWAHLAPVGTL